MGESATGLGEVARGAAFLEEAAAPWRAAAPEAWREEEPPGPSAATSRRGSVAGELRATAFATGREAADTRVGRLERRSIALRSGRVAREEAAGEEEVRAMAFWCRVYGSGFRV